MNQDPEESTLNVRDVRVPNELSMLTLLILIVCGVITGLVGLNICISAGFDGGFGRETPHYIRRAIQSEFWTFAPPLLVGIGVLVFVIYRSWKTLPNLFSMPASIFLSLPMTVLVWACSSAVFIHDRFTANQRVESATGIVHVVLLGTCLLFLIIGYFRMPRVPEGHM